MTETAPLPRTPAYGVVIREQIRTVFLASWREAAVIVALLAVAAVAAIYERVGASETNEGQPGGLPFFVLVGLLSPLVFWKGEKLHRGAYIWTLPVDRRRHAIAKTLAGWVWLMLSFVGFLGWLLAVTLLSGGTVGTEETRLMIPAGAGEGRIPRAALQEVPWVTPWVWIVPFTSGTIAYLLGTAFFVGLKHPWRWAAGLLLGFIVLVMLMEEGLVWGGLQALLGARFGLDWALSGGVWGLSTEVATTEGQVVVAWQGFQTAQGWIEATLLWTLIGVFSVWAALRRHREG